MKILMTGFTALQRGPKRQPGNIVKIDVPAAIVEALREWGHEVDWRPVALGEDLEGYDVAWVNLARPISMNSRVGAFGSLWTLTSGLPCVGFYDDWQAPLTVQNDCAIMTRRPRFMQKHIVDPKDLRDRASEILGEKIEATWYSREDAEAAAERVRNTVSDPKEKRRVRVYRFYDEWSVKDIEEEYSLVEKWRPYLDATVEAMATGERWAAGMVPVCPMYPWGDRSIVQDILPKGSTQLLALDPSEIIIPTMEFGRDLAEQTEKKREWLLAALMPADQFVKKTEFGWPFWNTGSVSLIKRLGQGERVKTERDVIARYAERWGAVSPPYEHAGSGWWRSRFLYAASTGTVMVADPKEVEALGPAYQVDIPTVEGLTDSGLANLASFQADALYARHQGIGALGRAAQTAVERAANEDTWTWEDAR